MLTDLINMPELSVLDRTTAFAQRRHELIANNIANIDTPGYKMRDLDVKQFQADLNEQIAKGQVQSGGVNQLPVSESNDQYLVFHDGNNRSIEKQMTAMTENQLLHNVAVELMRSRYELLERAIALRF